LIVEKTKQPNGTWGPKMTQLHDYQLEEMFDEMLDQCHEPVKFGYLSYDVSIFLKRVDPVAYRQEFLNYLDLQLSDGILFEHADGSIHDEEEEEAV